MPKERDKPEVISQDIRVYDLDGEIDAGAGLEFTQAETLEDGRSPFVLIRFKERGVEPDHGLRYDLDKRVFLDHFEDKSKEAAIHEAESAVFDILQKKMSEEDFTVKHP